MLPAARIRGHKEWTTRKSDPIYSMDWRRDRVANFVPREPVQVAPPVPATQEDDDDMKTLVLARLRGTNQVWASNGIHRVFIKTNQELADRQWWMKQRGATDAQVQVTEVDRLDFLGTPVDDPALLRDGLGQLPTKGDFRWGIEQVLASVGVDPSKYDEDAPMGELLTLLKSTLQAAQGVAAPSTDATGTRTLSNGVKAFGSGPTT